MGCRGPGMGENRAGTAQGRGIVARGPHVRCSAAGHLLRAAGRPRFTCTPVGRAKQAAAAQLRALLGGGRRLGLPPVS